MGSCGGNRSLKGNRNVGRLQYGFPERWWVPDLGWSKEWNLEALSITVSRP